MIEGNFRQDLYYRLNVINLQLPPLRERAEDILPLAEFLLKKFTTSGTTVPAFGPELRHAFLTHHWPGNVRELENTIRKLICLRDGELLIEELRTKGPKRSACIAPEPIVVAESPKDAVNESARAPLWEQVKRVKRQAEADAIVSALDATRWNRKQAAALLQIDYKALLYKMKTLGVRDKNRVEDTNSRGDAQEVLTA
jgi:DNA-binding NtrC family response regulator